MILSSTSPYALLKEFSIACGFKYDAVFRVCLNNFCERLQIKYFLIVSVLSIKESVLYATSTVAHKGKNANKSKEMRTKISKCKQK